ncbi:acetyl esterase/lipase [Rhizobium azooxidifex]|uniref:Acetyl esterase/lipase n=1 Tax=Mycoplana azooxidifex TaxID=1636188 RepID=A0A7W6DIP8_9HYPH|nr:alpha/beta hydrolase [Mycoplana azooxidifex]MBB3979724.1 acetyl esterase/lipase [Mycoplana azooxidifex]
MRVLVDLEFGDRLALDAYVPDAPSGAILLLHGGWLAGDKSGETALAERLCKSGFVVFSANFNLDRSGPHGRALNDAAAALRWLRASDFEFGRACVAVMGVGTGGTVAIEVGLQEGVPVVAWSALIDFKGFMDSTAALGDSDHLRDYYGVSWDAIAAAGEQVPYLRSVVLAIVANNLSLLASTSPLTRVTPKAGRMLLFNSTDEVIPVRGVALMQEAMTERGVPCTVSLLEGPEHGSEYLLSALPSTIQFFREVLSPKDSEISRNALGNPDRHLTGIAPDLPVDLFYAST